MSLWWAASLPATNKLPPEVAAITCDAHLTAMEHCCEALYLPLCSGSPQQLITKASFSDLNRFVHSYEFSTRVCIISHIKSIQNNFFSITKAGPKQWSPWFPFPPLMTAVEHFSGTRYLRVTFDPQHKTCRDPRGHT